MALRRARAGGESRLAQIGYGREVSARGPAEMQMKTVAMRAKEIVRELVDRMPDDCKLGDGIERILLLEGPWLEESTCPI